MKLKQNILLNNILSMNDIKLFLHIQILIDMLRHLAKSIKYPRKQFPLFLFSVKKISQQDYKQLSEAFLKNPSFSIFREYSSPTNLIEIFNIVKDTKISPSEKLKNYQEIQKLCNSDDDSADPEMQFNILANIYSDKTNLFLMQGKVTQALISIEKAAETIQAMENPHFFEVAVICKTAGQLNLKTHSFKKALKYYEDSQHFINIVLQQIEQRIKEKNPTKQQISKTTLLLTIFLARLYSEFVMLYLQIKNLKKAEEYLNKSLQHWNDIPNHNNNAYLILMKYQCILKLAMKKENQAIQTAEEYLRNYEQKTETKFSRLWFYKFLGERGLEEYRKKLKEHLTVLRKEMSELQLKILLRQAGVKLQKEIEQL